MIIVDNPLAKLEADGSPIRVAVVGAGFQGAAIVRQIITSTRRMRIVGVANRHVQKATQALESAGVNPISCEGSARIRRAISEGRVVATEDATALVAADGVDVVVEVTGSIEYAARVAVVAIENGKHLVHMNAELDGTVGPILKARADRSGVIYSFSDGDQPGVQMNLLRFLRGIGITPRLSGSIRGLHDRNPETQKSFAEKWGQKQVMVSSFADGTKIAYEQAIVANGNNFRVARRGMLGPDFSHGDPTAPLVPIEEAICAFSDAMEVSGSGLVDYVVGAHPGPGVFVLGTHDDARQRHSLSLYKLGAGPYYCFCTPYHLCHFEVPSSIARAALFGDAVLAPLAGPVVGVVATAKKDLAIGDVVSEFGGFEAYGLAENQDTVDAENLLPFGLALGAKVVRDVPKDQVLTVADVAIPPGRLVDALYAEQRVRFSPPVLPATAAVP